MNSRRSFLASAMTLGTAACAVRPARAQARVVIVGGGFGGASAANALRRLAPEVDVTLVEPNATYTACPFSNLVIAGERQLEAQQFSYANLAARGVRVVQARAADVDPVARSVTLDNGATLGYDKLVMAPGIDIDWSLPGYDAEAARGMPHAWRAGAQTKLLRQQLTAMPDGGTFVMAIPEAPYRCPPGPYERASLIAHYLKNAKPRAKILLLDAKDRFSKMSLFREAWAAIYGDMIEWQGASDGATVVEVDAENKILHTDFDRVRADVANVIPPQRAGVIAARAGVADASGWCPIEPQTFASTLQQHIHVIGDAAIANAMPKSAFAANAQGKLCAVQVVRALNGDAPVSSKLINTCYSLVTPDYGISVAGVYEAGANAWLDIDGAGGVSPSGAAPAVRQAEARYAGDWFATITQEVFG